MLKYIKGTIIRKNLDSVILESGGFGFEISFPAIYMDELGVAGDEARIYTEMMIRGRDSDGEVVLFGFPEMNDLKLFKLLTSVSKIGPKMALNIMSQLRREVIIKSVTESDWRTLTSVNGLGTKTSQRIVVELSEKMAKEFMLMPVSTDISELSDDNDLKNALKTLGYNQGEIKRAIMKVSSELTGRELSEKIRIMLGVLSK